MAKYGGLLSNLIIDEVQPNHATNRLTTQTGAGIHKLSIIQ